MRYEVRSIEDGSEVYDSYNRQTVATFPDLRGENHLEGDSARKRASRYMAQLILAENAP